MSFEHPGSTKVVSWKDDLPEYITVDEDLGIVEAHLGDSVGETLYRYDTNDVFKAATDSVHRDFNCSLEEFVSKCHNDLPGDHFNATVGEVKEKL